MSKSLLINAGLFFSALIISYIYFMQQAPKAAPVSETAELASNSNNTAANSTQHKVSAIVELNEDGEKCIRDAGGVLVPIHTYSRIMSLSISSDAWLLACLGPERILAYCTYSQSKPYMDKLNGKLHFGDGKNIEGLLAAQGDLIIMPSSGGDYSVVNRLREAGLTVFNIGDMSGFESFKLYARQIAHLCAVPVAGDALLVDFEQKMQAIKAGIKPKEQKRALYLSVYADQCYGGTKGSSFHDVLSAAGLIDVSDQVTWKWSSAWPQFSIEQIIQMNPDIIITQVGMREHIQRMVGLKDLKAVSSQQVFEIEPVIMNDPGLLMYEAAQRVHQLVYAAEQK